MSSMRNMTLTNIATACGGRLENAAGREDTEITCAVLDSRKVEPGGLFFATVGERVDGHKFIGQVFSQGAVCVVTEKSPAQVEAELGVPAESWGAYILVEDTFAALKKIAAYYRSTLTISVVGITGSVGKTSTKEFIAGVLAEHYNVLKTEGNYNNEVGLPLTLLRIRREHQVAVVEMGISDFGEMSRLGEMARPDICVITNIGQCHLENLHDRAGIFKAKTEIFDYMQENGEVCLNGEDDLLAAVKQVNGKPVHHFGISETEGFEVYATDIENKGLFGSSARLHFLKIGAEQATYDYKPEVMNVTTMDAVKLSDTVYPIEISLPGQHMVINACAAATVGSLLGLSPEEIQEGIRKVEPVGGRSHIIQAAGLTIIDDCYNANPVSMKAALDLLATAAGRRVAVLGDMFELGTNSDKLHTSVGSYAVEQDIEVILCVGENSRFMYDAALEAYDGTQDVRYFETREELLEALPELICEGDTILVKASHGMGFTRVVEELVH